MLKHLYYKNDLKCVKDNTSWKEGLQELGKFVHTMSLPKPMIIYSGNGLHVYWVLTEELEPQDWKPLANAMKQAALDKGFKIDAGLTANSALVLRPVGTPVSYTHIRAHET